jgi:translation initiation factor IF-1
MPKNTGGGKHKFRKKSSFETHTRKVNDMRKNIEEGTIYGQIIAGMGNRRFTVLCQQLDASKPYKILNCILAGSVRKRVSAGMYVLVQDWGDLSSKNKGTIIDFYTQHDVDTLKAHHLWDYENIEKISQYSGIGFKTTVETKKPTEKITEKVIKREEVNHFDFDIDEI